MTVLPALRGLSPLRLLMLSGVLTMGWLIFGATTASADPLPSPPVLAAPAAMASVRMPSTPALAGQQPVRPSAAPAASARPTIRPAVRPAVSEVGRSAAPEIAKTAAPALTHVAAQVRSAAPPVAAAVPVAQMAMAAVSTTAAPLQAAAVHIFPTLAGSPSVAALGPPAAVTSGPASSGQLTSHGGVAQSSALLGHQRAGGDSALSIERLLSYSAAVAGLAGSLSVAERDLQPPRRPANPATPEPSTVPASGQASTGGHDRATAGMLPGATIAATSMPSHKAAPDEWVLPKPVALDPGSSPD